MKWGSLWRGEKPRLPRWPPRPCCWWRRWPPWAPHRRANARRAASAPTMTGRSTAPRGGWPMCPSRCRGGQSNCKEWIQLNPYFVVGHSDFFVFSGFFLTNYTSFTNTEHRTLICFELVDPVIWSGPFVGSTYINGWDERILCKASTQLRITHRTPSTWSRLGIKWIHL